MWIQSPRSPREGEGNPIQCSYLENSMDRGDWQATVHEITKSQTRLSTHAHKALHDYLSILLSLPSLLRVPLSSLSFLKHVKSPPQLISTHCSLFLEALLYPLTPGSSCGSFLIPFRSLVKCHLLWHSPLLNESKIFMLPTYHLHPFLYLFYFLLSCIHLLPLYHIIICLFSFYVSLPLQCKLCEGGDIFFLAPHLKHEI